ncbi:MAG: HEAT repeat domain-containing protein [Acidobacteriia bacterium]|nr:HEAT repeat domain-containing protein [Terriglobia bacterium]
MKPLIPKACALALLILFQAGGGPMGADANRDQAWEILRVNLNEKSAEKRVQAVHALSLLPGNTRALQLAEKAAADEKPEVRAAAATALASCTERHRPKCCTKCSPTPSPQSCWRPPAR